MKLPKLKSELSLNSSQHCNSLQPTRRFHFRRGAISELPLSDQILFEQFGQGPYAVPEYSCLHTAIEAQAIFMPNQIAAIHEEEKITYG